jgi:hypothetical protein
VRFGEKIMKNAVNPDLAVALIGYKDAILADYAKFADSLEYTKNDFGVEFAEGSKYVKIVSVSAGGSRSVHSFVEKSTGDILKAASWAAPARNFTRGNVYITSSYEKRVRWTGIC